MHRPLTLGFSTCPNDTFVFYALAHRLVDLRGLTFDIALADVEALNQKAAEHTFDISKLSFAAIGHLLDDYALLPSGAALGRGCGPLIVARPGFNLKRLGAVPIAVPGLWTSACLLLSLFTQGNPRTVPMSFEKIMPAVSSGQFEAGVIIHEGRFTFEEYGLACLLDLGQWWESETALPIPLGGIAIRKNLSPEIIKNAGTIIEESVRYAHAHPAQADEYIVEYAQEMDSEVIRRHIELYVNDFTLSLGEEGRRAIEVLFEKARGKNLLPSTNASIFA